MQHKAVLVEEVLAGLAIKPDGVYVDATFGRGGHSQAILNQLNEKGRLFAIDKDNDAIEYANKTIKDKRFIVHKGSFAMLQQWIESQDLYGKVDGILLDLGVSSPQLDTPERGFSFLRDGPLDMRMDREASETAEDWINCASEEEIASVLKEYGEERFSKRIAHAIVKARQEQRITTTLQLANIVKVSNPAWEKNKHPATRSFQAIRIYINHELEALAVCLTQCVGALKKGGRLTVISFHSLEDRIVKRFLRREAEGSPEGIKLPKELPIKQSQLQPRIKMIGKKQRPSAEEMEDNPRARSAVLRIAEKII